jgi:heptosyltransferase-2
MIMSSMTARKKILIIAPSWIGDLVMAQALFKLLKKQDPSCSIDVLANKILHPILEHIPEVDNYLTLPFEHGELKLFERFKLAKQLRKNFYTHAYVLPSSFKSALIPFWANIQQRTGWRGEYRYILLNNIKPPAAKTALLIESLVALGVKSSAQLPTPLPLPQLQVSSKKLAAALERLKIALPKQKILALCPGAEYGTTKRWPTAYFAKIAQIKKSEGWEVWIFGGSKDKILAQEIQTQSDNICLDLTGKTNLSEAIELLSLATAVITNDSGLMHIAAAINRPLVAIYGSSSPKFTPPLTDKAKIISLYLSCSPCFKRNCPLKHMKCLNDLPPKLVLQSINELCN